MSCIASSTISILINGALTPFFNPTREIRQGDPLSPYLFILCLEMLTRKIHSDVDYRHWHPIKLSNNGPQISHLFFADDITLISKLNTKSIHSITDTLTVFTNASGQSINYNKSKVFFSHNVTPGDKDFVLYSFNMKEGTHFGKYLRFLIFTQHTHKVKFSIPLGQIQTLTDRMEN